MQLSSRRTRRVQLVLPLVMPTVRLERGTKGKQFGERVAIIASYANDNIVTRSLATLTREFENNGYSVVLVRASDDERPLEWPVSLPADPVIVRKSNIGYDFGSWAAGLSLFPSVRRKRFVILANDSLVGPFASITPMIESFEASTTDVWAATNTSQFHSHIQSYFVGYREGVLNDRGLRQFWSNLVVETEKTRIIHRYELGLSRLLLAEGFTTSACFESERLVSTTENPTMGGWKGLLGLGFPFVKRELLTNSAVVPDGGSVPAEIHERFGTDPRDWL